MSLSLSRLPCALRALDSLRPNTIHTRTLFKSAPKPPKPSALMAAMTMTPQIWADTAPTTLTFFHNPDNPLSVSALKALEEAKDFFPPFGKLEKPEQNHFTKFHGPLKLDITVKERPPTSEEFSRILRILTDRLGAKTLHTFTHPSVLATLREHPTNIPMLAQLVSRTPEILRWPVIIDWYGKKCSLGGEDYKVFMRTAAVKRKEALLKDIERRKKREKAREKALAKAKAEAEEKMRESGKH
ncbi:hypothetical protein R3P38DRAFT_602521 [Favolaschia claudopus]|uniref:Uncharacterized protein n=1 Tax=Favolaschia claudopus TaxID=2862362 RepID=A0AAW0C9F5_9AGAR